MNSSTYVRMVKAYVKLRNRCLKIHVPLIKERPTFTKQELEYKDALNKVIDLVVNDLTIEEGRQFFRISDYVDE